MPRLLNYASRFSLKEKKRRRILVILQKKAYQKYIIGENPALYMHKNMSGGHPWVRNASYHKILQSHGERRDRTALNVPQRISLELNSR